MVSLAERRRCVTYLRNAYEATERRACQVMQINRSSYRYIGEREPVDECYARVVNLSQHLPLLGLPQDPCADEGRGLTVRT